MRQHFPRQLVCDITGLVIDPRFMQIVQKSFINLVSDSILQLILKKLIEVSTWFQRNIRDIHLQKGYQIFLFLTIHCYVGSAFFQSFNTGDMLAQNE